MAYPDGENAEHTSSDAATITDLPIVILTDIIFRATQGEYILLVKYCTVCTSFREAVSAVTSITVNNTMLFRDVDHFNSLVRLTSRLEKLFIKDRRTMVGPQTLCIWRKEVGETLRELDISRIDHHLQLRALSELPCLETLNVTVTLRQDLMIGSLCLGGVRSLTLYVISESDFVLLQDFLLFFPNLIALDLETSAAVSDVVVGHPNLKHLKVNIEVTNILTVRCKNLLSLDVPNIVRSLVLKPTMPLLESLKFSGQQCKAVVALEEEQVKPHMLNILHCEFGPFIRSNVLEALLSLAENSVQTLSVHATVSLLEWKCRFGVPRGSNAFPCLRKLKLNEIKIPRKFDTFRGANVYAHLDEWLKSCSTLKELHLTLAQSQIFPDEYSDFMKEIHKLRRSFPHVNFFCPWDL